MAAPACSWGRHLTQCWPLSLRSAARALVAAGAALCARPAPVSFFIFRCRFFNTKHSHRASGLLFRLYGPSRALHVHINVFPCSGLAQVQGVTNPPCSLRRGRRWRGYGPTVLGRAAGSPAQTPSTAGYAVARLSPPPRFPPSHGVAHVDSVLLFPVAGGTLPRDKLSPASHCLLHVCPKRTRPQAIYRATPRSSAGRRRGRAVGRHPPASHNPYPPPPPVSSSRPQPQKRKKQNRYGLHNRATAPHAARDDDA